MPNEPPDPMVTSQFLDDLRACTWSAGHLLNAAGATVYPRPVYRVAKPYWEIGSNGCLIDQAAYMLLRNGSVLPNGTFSSGGATYALRDQNGYAIAVRL